MVSPAQRYVAARETARRGIAQGDGTLTLRAPTTASRQATTFPQWTGTPIGTVVDDLTAVQLAVWQVLDGMRVISLDRAALIRGVRTEANTFLFDKVHLDWPDPEDDAVPYGQPVIRAAEDTETLMAGSASGQQLLEDTVNAYQDGTVLQLLGEAQTPLEIVVLFAHKDDRAACRRAMLDAFYGSPQDERQDRQVVVPHYFDRPVRLSLQRVGYPDSGEQVQRKTFPLVVRILATVEVVRLVKTPPEMRPKVVIDPEADPADADLVAPCPDP